MGSVVIQPDAAGGLDATIHAGATNNVYGTCTYMWVGTNSGNAKTRGLIYMPLTLIPSNATIQTAVLSLYCDGENNTTDRSVSVYRLLRQVYEGVSCASAATGGVNSSTWQYRNSNGPIDNWNGGTAGTHYALAATSSATITGSGAWFDWDVLADVNDWYTGAAANYGWMLIGYEAAANGLKQFVTSDYTTDPALRPKLTVTWTGGPGARSFAVVIG